MNNWRKDRIGAARRGENPMVITRMRSGFAVIGDNQFIPGYCVLLADPQVNHLSDLSYEQRGIYLQDMGLVGEALMKVCQPRRVNYEILGNTDTYLHAHIFPRYNWEPIERQGHPVWLYPESAWDDDADYSDEKYGDLKQRIKDALEMLIHEHHAF